MSRGSGFRALGISGFGVRIGVLGDPSLLISSDTTPGRERFGSWKISQTALRVHAPKTYLLWLQSTYLSRDYFQGKVYTERVHGPSG